MRWSILLAVADAGKHVYRAGSAPTITHNTLVKRGVILWAHGRSATDTYCLTLRRSARMNFCRHMKEGFNTKHASGVLLRKKRLEKCGKSGELLTHIKPSHVRNSSRTDVRSPDGTPGFHGTLLRSPRAHALSQYLHGATVGR